MLEGQGRITGFRDLLLLPCGDARANSITMIHYFRAAGIAKVLMAMTALLSTDMFHGFC